MKKLLLVGDTNEVDKIMIYTNESSILRVGRFVFYQWLIVLLITYSNIYGNNCEIRLTYVEV